MTDQKTRKNVGVRKPSPIDIYVFLPRTNCRECGEENCLAFAAKVVNGELPIERCCPLLSKKHEKEYKRLKNLLKPTIKEVIIGTGEHAVKIGGQFVMRRHELAYFNPAAIAIDVTDEMSEEEILERITKTKQFTFEHVGQKLKLDMIAIRSTSNNAERFAATVEKVAENTNLPLILCSLDPKILEKGLTAVSNSRPLLYAATEDNLEEMAALALRHNCPLTILAPNNVSMLKSLTKKLLECGVEDIVLDPGTFPIDHLPCTLNNFTMIRRAAFEEGDAFLGFPLIGVPAAAWIGNGESLEEISKWREAYLAAMLIVRYADILVMHNLSGWALLPLVVLRQSIYTDPRKPALVESGLRIFGAPDKNSPVMFTTNFALTYYTVASDLESAKVNAYLIVVDTEGIAVDSAVAGRNLTAEKVATAIRASSIGNKVKHRVIIIPGKAARLSGEIGKLSGWQVLVGPRDSSDIPQFLQGKWKTRT